MPSSERLYQRACEVIPGGVNSPVRAFNAVGGTPVFMRRGSGCRVESVDGDSYVDFCGSFGPLILGHAHPKVVEVVQQAAVAGTTFGTCVPAEAELAELIRELVPSIEKLRLVNSGTEAAMTALRLARAATGRRKIIKFAGNYHGHSDAFLVAAGSGLLTAGIAASRGVPESGDVYVVPYNDLAGVREVVDNHGAELAAICVEPVAGNMGLVPPEPDFLPGLRELCDACGAVLLFDEVITGFRLAPTTYGELRGVRPDLTCLGKIIGGGMPIGALGGRRQIMAQLAPEGDVYQAGTLSGNPVAVAAGLATLRTLLAEDPYPELERLGERLANGLQDLAPGGAVNRAGGMFTYFFAEPPVRCQADAQRSDGEAFARFFHGMLRRGYYLPPSQFEVNFISAAHGDAEIDGYLAAAGEILRELNAG